MRRVSIGMPFRGESIVLSEEDLSILSDIVSDNGCRRGCIAGHHDRAYSQRVQFRDQRCGIRPGRIAKSNDPGKFQRRWRTDRHGQDPETLRLEVIRRLGRIRLRLRQFGHFGKGPFDGANRGAAGIGGG